MIWVACAIEVSWNSRRNAVPPLPKDDCGSANDQKRDDLRLPTPGQRIFATNGHSLAMRCRRDMIWTRAPAGGVEHNQPTNQFEKNGANLAKGKPRGCHLNCHR